MVSKSDAMSCEKRDSLDAGSQRSGHECARILRGQGAVYHIAFKDGRTEVATLRGRLRQRSKRPCAGDLVLAELVDDPLAPYCIERIFERSSYLERPAIANLDTMYLVASLSLPRTDSFHLDKLLALLHFRGIETKVIFSKLDELSSELREFLLEAGRQRLSFSDFLSQADSLDHPVFGLLHNLLQSGVEIYLLDQSSSDSECLCLPSLSRNDYQMTERPSDDLDLPEALIEQIRWAEAQYRRRFQQQTYEDCLSRLRTVPTGSLNSLGGASGVGKSTLFNALLGSVQMETGELSSKMERGRQTTRHVEICRLASAYFADSPGFEKLEVERVLENVEDLEDAFPEVQHFREYCQFRSCRHDKERQCAVRLYSRMTPERLQHYQILRSILEDKRPY
ncbi:MAG: GTPase RsgA [Eubacteriales bacterium]|nr:GTPase RsgA [Eubacteriales bacterium]